MRSEFSFELPLELPFELPLVVPTVGAGVGVGAGVPSQLPSPPPPPPPEDGGADCVAELLVAVADEVEVVDVVVVRRQVGVQIVTDHPTSGIFVMSLTNSSDAKFTHSRFS